MIVDSKLQSQLRVAFDRLNRTAAASGFPPPMSLSATLEKLLPSGTTVDVPVDPKVAALFATASVDMWLRSIHSLLISASITKASPIWAAVSGYYASHYAVRAAAHLLGCFQLYQRKRIVNLGLEQGAYICSFQPKGAGAREHKLYWNWVKQDQHFNSDSIFVMYNPSLEQSDVQHRDRANYADHLSLYPNFRPLNEGELKERIQIISKIEFIAAPIPSLARFVDIDSVQTIAYHRIVKYRQFLDAALGTKSRFWDFHRNPGFAAGIVNFQLVERPGLSILRN
jgi:hypothetical protein